MPEVRPGEGVSGRRGGPPPPPPPKEGELHCLYNQQDSGPCNGQIYLAGGSAGRVSARGSSRTAGRCFLSEPGFGGISGWGERVRAQGLGRKALRALRRWVSGEAMRCPPLEGD